MFKFPVASPYHIFESVHWIWKNATGLNRDGADFVYPINRAVCLNEGLKERYTLAFIGDILPTRGRTIQFGKGLREMISNCDLLVGNLEGIVTDVDKDSWMPTSDLRHDSSIISVLADLFPPERTCLSLANNHSGDFGQEEFLKSAQLFRSRKFKVVGWGEQSFVDLNPDIRVVAGSQWSNRNGDFLFRLDQAGRFIKRGAFNILFPHYGYEFELFPRPEIMLRSRVWLHDFDAVIGHHSHCPQPVCSEKIHGQGHKKLLAYSLGDFLDPQNKDSYRYGIVVKLRIGQDPEGHWGTGQVEWQLTSCRVLPGGGLEVEVTDEDIFSRNSLRSKRSLNS